MKISPKEFVDRLEDKVIGQSEAKRILAVALRNRWRRLQLDSAIRKTITPKNLLMIGPTGVGKTAIIRAMADIIDAPMIKVEATKYTQVGYVGEDVKSIINELIIAAKKRLQDKKESFNKGMTPFNFHYNQIEAKALLDELSEIVYPFYDRALETVKDIYSIGQMDDFKMRVETVDKRVESIDNYIHLAILMFNDEILPTELTMTDQYTEEKDLARRKFKNILKKYSDLFDCENRKDSFQDISVIEYVENYGIVFIDEIDKIAVNKKSSSKDNVGKAGVQRDLLAILDGTDINTYEGIVNTENIMFIAAGAFHENKVTDLMPELLGRLPIRVDLDPINLDTMVKILTNTIDSPIKQYIHLLKTEGVTVKIDSNAIKEIAVIADTINTKYYSMGARTLQMVVEVVFTEVAFNSFKPYNKIALFVIDKDYVKKATSKLLERFETELTDE